MTSESSRAWKWPLLVAGVSLIGLLSALLGQGRTWWVLSWIALATPLLIVFCCLMR